MRNGRIKIGFYVELTDFRETELDKARELIHQLQNAVIKEGWNQGVIPDFDAAVKAARALPAKPSGRDMELEAWTLNACEQNDWVMVHTAEQLGISTHTLSSRMRRYKTRGLVEWKSVEGKWRWRRV